MQQLLINRLIYARIMQRLAINRLIYARIMQRLITNRLIFKICIKKCLIFATVNVTVSSKLLVLCCKIATVKFNYGYDKSPLFKVWRRRKWA